MKRILQMTAFALILVLGSSLRNYASAQYDNDRDVSYQTFYDELSPYGQWVDYPNYGYVWVPDAGDDFRPYSSNGHWVYTDDYEWMWVSDYDWGWAPFHYGRWEEDDYYGWFWVPGYEWSPAWVAWRDGGDYYGWAPIRPGINININFNIGGYSPPDNYWCFAPRRYITSPRLYDYCVDRRRNVTIIHQTTIIINNYNYGGGYGFRTGPRRFEAERYCGRINPVRLRESYNPGRSTFRNNEVNMYRPNVRRDENRQFAPREYNRFDRQNGNNRGERSDNGFRRNTDNRQGNSNGNGGFRRPEDNRRGNEVNNGNNNGNGRRERTDNPNFRRGDNNVREPQQQGGDNNGFRRRTERTDINNGQQGQPGGRRMQRPEDRRDDNNPGSVNTNRRFERSTTNGGNGGAEPQPERRPSQQYERRMPERQPAQQMERRQAPQQQPAQQMERRQAPQQQPVRQMERRQEPQQQPAQQTERRQAPRTEPSQQQPRQFERRGGNSGGGQPARTDAGSGNGSGNGGGRGRRF